MFKLRLLVPLLASLGLLFAATSAVSAQEAEDPEADATAENTTDETIPAWQERWQQTVEKLCGRVAASENPHPRLTEMCQRLEEGTLRAHPVVAACRRAHAGESDVAEDVARGCAEGRERLTDRVSPFFECRRAAQAEGLEGEDVVARCRHLLANRDLAERASDHPVATCRRASQADGELADGIAERCRAHGDAARPAATATPTPEATTESE
jgi:hypothetical protein